MSSEISAGFLDFKIELRKLASCKKHGSEWISVGKTDLKLRDLAGDKRIFICFFYTKLKKIFFKKKFLIH